MKIIFNGNLIDSPVPLSLNDRGFQYGDGYFETMLAASSKIPLLSYHLKRVRNGLSILKLDLSLSELEYLEENLSTLIQVNEINSDMVRAKLMVWRRASAGKGYGTTEHHANWMLMAFEHDKPFIRKGTKLGYSDEICIHRNSWSALKTLNALPYVMGSLECEEKGFNDLVLFNQEKHIAETIASNLFWMENGKWFTPDTDTGCIDGTMRQYFLNEVDPTIEVGFYSKDNLEKADSIITTNATGIGIVESINGKPLDTSTTIASEVYKKIFG